ncbi:MAG: acyltransferase family protein [Acidimicrobiales bacterium]
MGAPYQPAGSRRGYRPGFDGLRAVAVALVVAFHADWIPLSGGFVGVDVFFVLSGYLVTGILIDGLHRNGVVGFRRFYSRRIRRLLPLAATVLVLTAVVFTALSSPVVVNEARGSFAAAFLYVANWWFIGESTEYLGSDLDNNPILHFWSLAIEEQFYLVWPLVIAGVHRVASRFTAQPLRALLVLVAVAGVASFAAALIIGASDLNRAYYGTDTRAYQLLLGAFLSLLPAVAVRAHRRWAVLAGALGVGAIVILATDILSLSAVTRGAAAALATGVVIVVLESDAEAGIDRLLSLPAFTAIGRLSYGIYLWHLPAMFVLRDSWDLTPIQLLATAGAASIALSAASAAVIEGPIRHGRRLDRIPVPVIAAGLAVSLLGGLAIIPAALSPSTRVEITVDPDPVPTPDTAADEDPTVSTAAPAGPVVLEFDWEEVRSDRGESPDCRAADVSVCTVIEGDGPHVLLIGDSHAKVWQAAFVPYAEATGMRLSVASVSRCSWHLDTMVAISTEIQEECYRQQHEWVDEIVPALAPDIVVLIHRATFDPARPFLASEPRFLAASDLTIGQLVEEVPAVVVLEPTPLTNPESDPLVCLADGGAPDDCGFDATAEPTSLEVRYREIAAENPSVFTIDLDALACPRLPRCDTIVDDMVVFRDQSHMTTTYAASLGAQLIALDPLGPAITSLDGP